MARAVQPLSNTKINSAKPKEKSYKLSDGYGLYLEVMPNGSKLWRLKYKFEGKEKRISLGAYPDVTLKQSRSLREKYRQLIAEGIDPSDSKKQSKKKKITVDEIVDELFEQIAPGVTQRYLKKLRGYYENHAKPYIGKLSAEKVTSRHIIEIMNSIAQKDLYETAKKTFQLLERIFRYAVTKQYIINNVVTALDKDMLLKKKQVRHHPAIINDKELKILIEAIAQYQGEFTTRIALKLSLYLALRPKELRCLEWSWIDWNANIIRIPKEKMKMREEHLIPISNQVIQLLKELEEITGKDRFLFPNTVYKGRCMSENTVNVALRRMGFDREEMTAHGFRTTFSTIAHEKSNFSHESIEKQLAHTVGSTVSQAYNRSNLLDERRQLMQWWADYLKNL